MPSYIHGWCSDCVKKSSGCGSGCSRLTDVAGPPRCADACLPDMPGKHQFSKATSGDEFSTWARGLRIRFTGVTLTGPYGSWTLPDFGCSGSHTSGTCLVNRCASIEYASDELGEGCDIYLPDGYVSHTDGPSGEGTSDPDCTCGPGGGQGSCLSHSYSVQAYATRVDQWEVNSVSESEHPAFFVWARKPFCKDDSYCKHAEGSSCGSSICKTRDHTWALYAQMDGNVSSAVGSWGSLAAGDGCSLTGLGAPEAQSWPAGKSMIKIRQGSGDSKPKMYVSMLFHMRVVALGTEPAGCDWVTSTSSGTSSGSQIPIIGPLAWRITWVGEMSEDCACLEDITLTTVYSSSFSDVNCAQSCECSAACCSKDRSSRDDMDCFTMGVGDCIAAADDWCTGSCGDTEQSAPCSETGSPCWASCADGSASPGYQENPDGSYTFWGMEGLSDEYWPENPPCVEATCVTNCLNNVRGAKNSGNSWWNAGIPNVQCASCYSRIQYGNGSESEDCDDDPGCGCGTNIGNLIGSWPTSGSSYDYTSGSNFSVSSGGSVIITKHE